MSIFEKLKKEEIVDIKGKPHPKFKGLLRIAHEKIKSCKSKLICFPSNENDNLCIVHVSIQTIDDQFYEALGDANLKNVSKMVSAHFIRVAETRAYGRALRLMLGVGEAIAEEIDSDHSEEINNLENDNHPYAPPPEKTKSSKKPKTNVKEKKKEIEENEKDFVNIVSGKIKDMAQKEGVTQSGRAWTKSGIQLSDDNWYSTFDTKLYDLCVQAYQDNSLIEIHYKKNGQYNNIDNIYVPRKLTKDENDEVPF